MAQKERKYKSYVIKTIQNDETIHIYNGITSYKEALSIYKKTKDENKDKATVEFHGELLNEEFDLLFKKEYKSPECELDIIYTTYDMIRDMQRIQENLKQRHDYLCSFKGGCDKRINNLLHSARNAQSPVPIEFKVDFFDKVQEIECRRQQGDNERNIAKSLLDSGLQKYLEGVLETVTDIKEKQEKKYENIVINKKIPNKITATEIPYKSFKERVKLIKEAEKKFDKVTYDEEKKIVICYNKVYA